MQGLTDMLAQDVITWSDGGGKVLAALRPIYGAEAVTRLWLSLTRKAPADLAITVEDVNGNPALLLWVDEGLYSFIMFGVVDERIRGIYGVVNPDKLAYVARQVGARLPGPSV